MDKKVTAGLVFVLVVVMVVIFFWIANRLGSGEKVQSEKPLVICQPQDVPLTEQSSSAEATADKQKCFWTAHIHAHIKILQDNREVVLNFEQGKLEGTHTHSDRHQLHWHGLISVDPKTKEIQDWSQLSLLQLLKDLGLSIEDGPQIVLNGERADLSYTWEDGDSIEIRYAK